MFGLKPLLLDSMGAGDDKIGLLRSSNCFPGFQDRKHTPNTPHHRKNERLAPDHVQKANISQYPPDLFVHRFCLVWVKQGWGDGRWTGNQRNWME